MSLLDYIAIPAQPNCLPRITEKLSEREGSTECPTFRNRTPVKQEAMVRSDATTETDNLVLFWRAPGPLSQWTPSVFVINGETYKSAEQWMKAEKARLFGDEYRLGQIMTATQPRLQKAFGRKVRGFQQNVWAAHRLHIVVRGNMAKFGQNEEFREALLATGSKTIVYASPYDQVWGVGLEQTDERVTSPENWRGENLLGQALMVVRDHFTILPGGY